MRKWKRKCERWKEKERQSERERDNVRKESENVLDIERM